MKIREKIAISLLPTFDSSFSTVLCWKRSYLPLSLSPKLYCELYEKEKCIVRMICVTIKTSKHQYKD